MRSVSAHKLLNFVLVSLLLCALPACVRQKEAAREEPKQESSVEITRLDPDRAEPGSTVVVSGSGFSDDANDVTVSFGTNRARVKNAGQKVLVVEVPKDLSEGRYEVTVTNNRLNKTSAPSAFTVAKPTSVAERRAPEPEKAPAVTRERGQSTRPSTERRSPAPSSTTRTQPTERREPGRESTARTESTGQFVVVPADTPIIVRSTDAISTEKYKPGDQIELTLDEPLSVHGRLAAPKGSRVIGRVVESREPGRVKGRAVLAFRLVELIPSGGSPHPIATSAFSSEAPSSVKRDAVIIGGAAGIGTAIGAIAGGKKGAAIGAAAGAAGGTATVLGTKGKQVEIPSETVFRFRLTEPVTLPSQGRVREQTDESR